eukprot:CAMPEP_0174848790 /NCGR_PEP_ID=MMETSP1114-20130205/13721_1 /TAXON_ID=312471 /ORGANISM="Neobodo designis, Strain CCAP 1951/1" /LENGTH=544 /DNA_ID=CAMNT_0016083095 /DNA_START=105 /DNA_END=1736 /DNA_ORIENTATION=-
MGILEDNEYQRDAMSHADRLFGDLARILAGMDMAEAGDVRPSAARIAAQSISEPQEAEVTDDERQIAEAQAMPGSIDEFIPEVFVGTKRGMPKRDLVPPPKRHLGLIPIQYLEVEAMRQEERELGLWGSCHPLSDVRGLYIHGGVGSGKSALMNILYNELPTMHKKRTNFRQFVEEATEIYEAVHKTHGYESKDADHVMNEVGVRLCSSAEVLMLDDVRIQSDEEGTLLRRIFSAMYKIGVCAVFTSQHRPEELHSQTYKSRLSMESFVSMLYERCDMVDLGNDVDYRVHSAFKDSGVYLCAADGSAEAKHIFTSGFLQITDGRRAEPKTIHAYGRDIDVDRAVGGVCMVSYNELMNEVCPDDADLPLFCRTFHTVFIDELPQLSASAEARDSVVRFFKLIESMHAVGTKCVFHAPVECTQLIAPSTTPAISADKDVPKLVATENPDDRIAEEALLNNETMLREHEEFSLALRTCEAQLAEMQTVEYLRKPHTGRPVTLVDGAPNAEEILQRYERLKEQDRAAGRDPEREFEGSILTRTIHKRP